MTAKNDEAGNVVFDLVFENSGVYVYTLCEVAGTDSNITYDANTYTVTITVTDDLKGYLTAKVEYSSANGAAPEFKNAYTPNALALTLEGTKKLTGKDLEDGEFSFQVRDSQGNLVATGKNNAEGSIAFSQIKLPTAGKYTFRINEVKGNNVNVTYDETVFTVTVQVTNDNGVLKAETVYPEGGIVFENIYEKVDPNNPDTGDHSGIVVYAVILAASLLGMIVVLLAMNKPRRKAFRN
jgi:pilin isopeptide linkage protein